MRYPWLVILLIFSLLPGCSTETITPAESFIHFYGSVKDETANSMAVCPDGGYLLAGAVSDDDNNKAGYLVRTDSLGVLEWSEEYEGGGQVEFEQIFSVSGVGYFVFGSTREDGIWKFYAMIIDGSGAVLKENSYAGIGDIDAFPQSAIATSDGGFALLGSSQEFDKQILFIKIDSDLNEEWKQEYGDSGTEESGYSLVQLPDDGYAVCASRGVLNSEQLLYLRLQSDGTEVKNVYRSRNIEWKGTSIMLLDDDNLAILGVNRILGFENYDAFIYTLTPDGDSLDIKLFGESKNETPGSNCLIKTLAGGYAFTGFTNSRTEGGRDIYLEKVTPEGTSTTTNVTHFGGSRDDEGNAIFQTSNGGFVIAGTASSFGDLQTDVFLMRTNANLKLLIQ
ncbi:MAG: hypothetical protein H6581_15880 [Bacteroidia bacterium]|nr:hypothetical protein [Bacteroidia bacterium]